MGKAICRECLYEEWIPISSTWWGRHFGGKKPTGKCIIETTKTNYITGEKIIISKEIADCYEKNKGGNCKDFVVPTRVGGSGSSEFS